MQTKVSFRAEVKQTQQRKAASLDQVYKVVLETSDSNVLELGKLPYDTEVRVTVEVIK